MSELTTFRDLDGNASSDEEDDASLPHWYRAVRDVPLVDLEDGSLACALGQQLFLLQIVPQVLARLQADPLAGEKYEGELFEALNAIPPIFWQSDKNLAEMAKNVLSGITQKWRDAQVLSFANELAQRLETLPAIAPSGA